MSDPGLPPKPRSLNLLESLVNEEEERDKHRGTPNVTIPTENSASVVSSQAYYHSEKQQILTRETSEGSFKEFKMKDTQSSSGKVSRANPNAGFKGRKMKKQRSRSNSAERGKPQTKKKTRPFSADYNQSQRNKINTGKNNRPKTSKGLRQRKRSNSPQGHRSRSKRSYSSSDSYSSDEEYSKRKNTRHRSSSSSSSEERRNSDEHDSFFDSDRENKPHSGDNKASENINRNLNKNNKTEKKLTENKIDRKNSENSLSSKHDSSSDSYTSSEDDSNEPSTSKLKVHKSHSKDQRNTKTVYMAKNGKQRTRSDSESSDYQRMVVVDDYSSLDSEEEVKKVVTNLPPKPLLSRKKRQKYKLFQMSPDLYIEGKLQQKYCELEELMACSFVDQKSHVTRHHLYQMEMLRDQYQTVSRGRPSSAIVPRGVATETRSRGQRPHSAKRATQYYGEYDRDSSENAYSTIRSVMAAERARENDKIRTDILADRPSSAKRATKKKKKIEAKLKAKHSDTEEETSEKPSISSRGSSKGTNSTQTTPRNNGPSIDHHIKYTENEKLKKWLKEKDKIYRRQTKEEKKKKREEREKVINEANDRIESRIKSQKKVSVWMKEKNKELYQKQKEERKREKFERNEREQRERSLNLNGAMHIRSQSRSGDEGDHTAEEDPEDIRRQIHEKRDIEEENKQTKIAAEGGPHPPQTKFIYKRPVAGKIKLRMQTRGKSPVAQKANSEKKDDDNETEKEKMRLSYDEWVKKKRVDDEVNKRKISDQRKKDLAKSDPELDRIIPDVAKKRIENKLNSRKRIDTGLKKYDDKINKSFGGADFSGDESVSERPRSAYKLESDKDSEQPSLTVKQIKRPSTAPAGRVKVPHPKMSENSPRKAIIPKKVDKLMSNKDETNPYQIPFPPEQGIPEHVASRQRKLFADRITQNLNEIEQRALLNAELIREGVANIEDEEKTEGDNEALDKYETKMEAEARAEQEKIDKDKHPNISEQMYSPRKHEETSDSSEEENTKEENMEGNVRVEIKETVVTKTTSEAIVTETFNEQTRTLNEGGDVKVSVEKNHYKTFENLNELSLDSPKDGDKEEANTTKDDLGVDIEKLKKQVEALKTEPGLICKVDLETENNTNTETYETTEIKAETMDVNIEVIHNEEQNEHLVSILKESKRSEPIPVPEQSEEPTESSYKAPLDQETEEIPSSPPEDLNNSRKRVSFNEQTEVFQSFESTSTETVTPETADFDTNAESLDNQAYDYEGPDPDWEDNGSSEQTKENELTTNEEKVSINIGGFELNPTVIKGEDDVEQDAKAETESEPQSTFITEPSM